MSFVVLQLVWYLMVPLINGQTVDPLCDSCYGLSLIEIRDTSLQNLPRYAFKYDLRTCDFRGGGRIIIGSANAKNRCGAKLKQIITGIAGIGTVKHTIRTKGPLKYRGIEIGQNSNNRVQIYVEGPINKTAKIGYVSYASTGKMKDLISCPVTNTLPDYCAGSNSVTIYVGDEDLDADDWNEIIAHIDDIPEMEMDEIENLLVNNHLIVEGNYNHYQVSFYLMIAAVIMIPVMFILAKWMKPKFEQKGYDKIPSEYN